jgi:hypothetical protein
MKGSKGEAPAGEGTGSTPDGKGPKGDGKHMKGVNKGPKGDLNGKDGGGKGANGKQFDGKSSKGCGMVTKGDGKQFDGTKGKQFDNKSSKGGKQFDGTKGKQFDGTKGSGMSGEGRHGCYDGKGTAYYGLGDKGATKGCDKGSTGAGKVLDDPRPTPTPNVQ